MDKPTILLVDDDNAIRELLAAALSRRYRVIQASDGIEALALFLREPDAVDLVVTDVRMPVVDGIELAERLSAIRQTLKILFISGFFEEDERTRRLVHMGAAFMAKPFGVRTFVAKVNEIIDRRSPAGDIPPDLTKQIAPRVGS